MLRRDRPGKIIAGRYELLEPAGEGGMAVVWRAMVRGAGKFARPVALKRIHAAKGADKHMVQLFEEEARVGAALHHPNVVQIMDFGVDEEGSYFLVMEWMQGIDLYQWVRSYRDEAGATPWPIVTAIAVEVLRGLGAAHERIDEDGRKSPVIHRDVSPSNVLLGTNGTVKLTDFGLARAMDRASMTRPNVIKGKLAYCAPELISGSKASAQSDIFALGIVLWEALAQRRLFTGKNDLEVLLAVRKGEVESLTALRDDLPGALTLAVQQSLEPDPDARFETAKAMARALSAILHTHPEPIDAEPLGRSVRDAVSRLGLDKKKAAPAIPPASPRASVTDLSISEVEIMDTAPPTSIEVDVTDHESDEASRKVRGLWADGSKTGEPAPGDD